MFGEKPHVDMFIGTAIAQQGKESRMTDKMLLLSIGQTRRAFKISMASNESVKGDEVEKYHLMLKKNGDSYTLRDAREKHDQIERSKTHKYSKEDRDKLIKMRKERRTNTSNIAKELTRIEQCRLQAKQRGDADKVAELTEKLKELRGERSAAITRRRGELSSHHAALYAGDINKRNRARNE